MKDVSAGKNIINLTMYGQARLDFLKESDPLFVKRIEGNLEAILMECKEIQDKALNRQEEIVSQLQQTDILPTDSWERTKKIIQMNEIATEIVMKELICV